MTRAAATAAGGAAGPVGGRASGGAAAGRATPAPGRFALPPALADACVERLGTAPVVDIAGAARLLDRMAAAVPTGSTAKLEAMAAGRVPPGADPVHVAETWLARPELAWSCWAVCTLYAALVSAGGRLRADVLGARRIDPQAVPVDFHSVVELHDGAGRWLADPYFWGAPIAAPGGAAVRPATWTAAFADGPVWRSAVGSCMGRSILRYRTVTTPLAADDVEAFCRVSVTHSGVAARARAHLATVDGAAAAVVDRDGATRLFRWRADPLQVWGADCEVVEQAAWSDAVTALLAYRSQVTPGK